MRTMGGEYSDIEPTRAEVDALPGVTVLEFGSPFCGHCLRAQPVVEQALAGHTAVRHIRIADARGRRLGRSFTVKLWPTLIFLRDGMEVARVVRPQDAAAMTEALARIAL